MQYLTRVIETAVLVRKAVLLICGLATALIATALCLADGLVWPPITEHGTHRHVPGKVGLGGTVQ